MKYKSILAQIEALQKKADTARKAELAKTIAEIKAKMAATGVTLDDLRDAKAGKKSVKKAGKKAAKKVAKKAAKKTGAKRKVAPKYRHPSTGAEWTGRGRQPRWLADAVAKGAKLDSFLIARK